MEPFSTSGLIAIITTISTVVAGLVKIIEYLISYILKKNKPDSGLEYKQRFSEIHSLACKSYEILNQRDHDGIPLCYFPRSSADINKEILDSQRKISERLVEVASTQKQIAELLDRIERRLDANSLN